MLFYSIIFCFLFIILRAVYLLVTLNNGGKIKFNKKRTGKVKTMIVLGSGGKLNFTVVHTTSFTVISCTINKLQAVCKNKLLSNLKHMSVRLVADLLQL